MSILKQLSIESKIKLNSFKSPNKYDHLLENKVSSELDKILFNSNLSILSEPLNYNSGMIEIERLNINFIDLNKNIKYNYVELFSEKQFHLKLNSCYTITTNRFSYFNFEKCIQLHVANGSLKLNTDNSLTLLPVTHDLYINYFLGYFENNKYLNLNWTEQNA
jgi:hypothetical protein